MVKGLDTFRKYFEEYEEQKICYHIFTLYFCN